MRSYVFCTDKNKKLNYFYLEDNYFNQKNDKEKIILHKIPFAGDYIKNMAITCLTYKSFKDEKYFLFIFLNENKLKFFMTNFSERDLGSILNNLYHKNPNNFLNFEEFNKNFLKKKNINSNQNPNLNINQSNINNENEDLNYSINSMENNYNNNKNQSFLQQKKSLKNTIKFEKADSDSDSYQLNFFEYLLNDESDVKKLFLLEENNQFFICLLGEFNIRIIEISNNESFLDLYLKIKNLDIFESSFIEDIRFSMLNSIDIEFNTNNRNKDKIKENNNKNNNNDKNNNNNNDNPIEEIFNIINYLGKNS